MEKKLDPRTQSCFFIGYPNKSKGFKFYCPHLHTRIVETNNAKFLEDLDAENSSNGSFIFEEEKFDAAIPPDHVSFTIPLKLCTETAAIHASPEAVNAQMAQPIIDQSLPSTQPDIGSSSASVPPSYPTMNIQPIVQEPSRRSQRVRKSAIHKDFVVYLQEVDYIGDIDDPSNFKQAIESEHADLWRKAMEDELQSMKKNRVWSLVDANAAVKPIGCKWIFKTKRDSNGNIERHKAQLVAKGFTQRQGVDYTETFSPVSLNDSLRTIMALVAHFNLELHQMDVKTAFLNGDLAETIYMI